MTDLRRLLLTKRLSVGSTTATFRVQGNASHCALTAEIAGRDELSPGTAAELRRARDQLLANLKNQDRTVNDETCLPQPLTNPKGTAMPKTTVARLLQRPEPKRTSLTKLLRARPAEPDAAELIKQAHRSGGQPLRKGGNK